MRSDDRHATIAAVATAPGAAGVAVVRISGDEAFAIAERLSGHPMRAGRIAYRPIRNGDGRILDDAVVLAFKAPHSYTGEDVVEIQCHGGSVTPRRILEATFAFGARLAHRGEFTERAFMNGRLDYDQAESVLDLIQAKTARAADAALGGMAGSRQHEFRALYDRALEISSTIEHALDVDEDELPPDFFPSLRSDANRLGAAIASAIAAAREGRILRDGALVVLAGPPNAGKSSLLNALLNEDRAIVSDVPGTTRDAIEAWIDLEGWPIRLVDTAGLRTADDAIEAEGVRRSESLVSSADVVLGLDCELGIRVHSKCDVSRGDGMNVSAKTGEGLAELKRAIVAALESKCGSTTNAPAAIPDERQLSVLVAAKTILTEQLIPFLGGSSSEPDIVLAGNVARNVAEELGTLVGATYSEDLLDALFSRFCVGK